MSIKPNNNQLKQRNLKYNGTKFKDKHIFIHNISFGEKTKTSLNQVKFFNIGPVGEFSYPIFKLKKKIVNYI